MTPAPLLRRRMPQRLAAGTAAVVVTLATLLPLGWRAGPTADNAHAPPLLVYLRPLPATPTPAASVHPQVAGAPVPPRRSPTVPPPPLRPAPAPMTAAIVTPGPAPTTLPAAAAPSPPPSPASAPLMLDATVLRAAAARSRSAVGRMADASGAYVGDTPRSEREVLAAGVASAQKPDCVRPGGSLLSALVTLAEVVGDHCR